LYSGGLLVSMFIRNRVIVRMKKQSKPKVSVTVCTYNEGPYLHKCISSILNQTFKDFELIIVDDGSTDNSHEVITSFKDSRIKYFKLVKNTEVLGKVRRFAVTKAKGEYVFVTDGDCWVKGDWIEQGLKAFKKFNVDAIEGKIIYHRWRHYPTLSDRRVSNYDGSLWMTGNMAYTRKILDKFSFNSGYYSLEDRELALKIIRKSKIPFIPTSVVYHQKKIRNVRTYLKGTRRVISKVKLLKELGDSTGNRFRILNPEFLLVLFFPPLILAEFFYGRIKSWNDLKLLPFVWVKAVYMRYLIWKTAIQERVFVI